MQPLSSNILRTLKGTQLPTPWYIFSSLRGGGQKLMSMGKIYVWPYFLFIVVWQETQWSDTKSLCWIEITLRFQTQTKITLCSGMELTSLDKTSYLFTSITIMIVKNWQNPASRSKVVLSQFVWKLLCKYLMVIPDLFNFWRYVSHISCYIV